MSKTTCNINLNCNDANTIFYSGQQLNGSVNINLYKEKQVTAIYLRISGIARSEWGEDHGHYRQYYVGKEMYLSVRIYFFGSEKGELVTVAPGTYNFDFNCELPEFAPTSLEKPGGYIRYTATVHFKRSIWPDKAYPVVFTVIKPYNLNDEPNLKNPVNKIESINFRRLLLIKSDELLLKVKLPKSGYVPGETIIVNFEAENKSNKHVHQFKVSLFLITTHFDTGKKNFKKFPEQLTSAIVSGCPSGQTITHTQSIIIPSQVSPTNLLFCEVHETRYVVKIKGKVDKGHFDPEIKIPIIIGTIPFDDNDGYDRSKLAAATEGATSFNFYDNHPPTYNETMATGSSKNSATSRQTSKNIEQIKKSYQNEKN